MAKKRTIEQGLCPKCGKDLDYGTLETTDSGIFYPASCSCGFEGKEHYEITFICFTDKQGKEIV